MKCRILHESQHKMRIHAVQFRMSMEQADLLEYYLRHLKYVLDVKVYERTGDAIIDYVRTDRTRQALIEALSRFDYEDPDTRALVPEHTGRALQAEYEEKLVFTVLGRAFRRIFFPAPLQIVWTVATSVRFIWMGIRSLLHGKLEVSVLDATAITASMLRGDFATAGSVMFLLRIGEILEEWTHKKGVDDLARSMSLKVDKVWVRADGGQDVLVPVNQVQQGDHIVIRTSNVIPLDGKVISGEATVNQASMTGESVPVVKKTGGYVFAGTVVEDGECVVEVTRKNGTGKYDQIVRMIEESEKLKSATETRAYHLADRLVPWSLGGTIITYLLTRNVTRAISFLMVDFSCALKLSMPLSVLSAIREAQTYDIGVKGGKFLEAAAQAQTIVFDKTGTLTKACPQVAAIYTFDGTSETEALRLAACLEEHYPHSVANAVVNEAKKRGIRHDEMHSEVKYVVAHGIASAVDGMPTYIGSYHFVFEDEHTRIPAGEEEKFNAIPEEYSPLYLAVDGVLRAVICIFDPPRAEAVKVINELHALGISKVVMMTGDNAKTAAAVARKLNLDEYHAEVLPEDKAAFIKKEHAAGRTVIMIGDGINDTPALSEADVGVAISDGAAIAREISDITISSGSLEDLVMLRKLSMALMDRIHSNYRFIIGFNASLITLGVLGILPPATSALLHNTSTIVTGLKSMTELLPEEAERRRYAD